MTDPAAPPPESAAAATASAPTAPSPSPSSSGSSGAGSEPSRPAPTDADLAAAQVLRESWKQLKRVRDRYAWLVTILLGGFNGALAKALDDLGVLRLWQVFVLTAPLVLAVAIIAYCGFSGRDVTPVGVALAVIGSALATSLIGLTSGEVIRAAFRVPDPSQCLRLSPPPPSSCDPGSAPPGSDTIWEQAWRLITVYWRVFGPKEFFAGIATGAVIGWLWALPARVHRKLLAAAQPKPAA